MNTAKVSAIPITIDGNEANVVNRVGSNVYAFQILKEIEHQTRDDNALSFEVLLQSPPITELPKSRKGWRYRVIGPQPLWTQVALPLYLWKNKQRIGLHYTPGHYTPRFCPVQYVSSVMDLGFLAYPDQFLKKDLHKLRAWTAFSVKGAQKVVAISKYTKQDVCQVYGRDPADVIVAPPALNSNPQEVSQEKQRALLEELAIATPYILFVGTIQPRKNLERLIKAFEILRTTQPEVQLVLAGKDGWLAEGIHQKAEQSSARDAIRFLGFVTEEQKAALYMSAECVVLPGLHEGFGIPPLEALQYGIVPVVANTTSLPEVVGEAGILVDPTSVESIADGVSRALSLSVQEKNNYSQKAAEQLKKYSWENSARTIVKTISSLL
ncbi:MAG: glycosyltransferase family 4 protein [Pseudomonadales bacterium]|nr:glycosyltransferase family 4 protein [Candidatus Woesebacteria bacterium]MCB9802172.1 glycosyltransferase family 4 protein [Pseudomonadales bacterium]